MGLAQLRETTPYFSQSIGSRRFAVIRQSIPTTYLGRAGDLMKAALLCFGFVLATALASGGSAVAELLQFTDDRAPSSDIVAPPTGWLSTLHPALRSSLMWYGDWETGNTSQWDNGQPWVSGPGLSSWQLVTAPLTHSGLFAMATTIDTTLGPAGVRWPRRDVPGTSTLATSAYYSTWLRLDAPIDADWFNVMQWKHTTADGTSSDPVWTINIGKQADGRDYLYLYRHVGNDGNYNTPGIGRAGDSSVPLPIGQWTHLEAYYNWTSEKTGSVIVYQDGQQIFRQVGVRTKFVHPDAQQKPRQWTINAYGDGVFPSPVTILFDDAAISGQRLGLNLQNVLPGDFNDDGVVDSGDYTTWRNGLGSLFTMADYTIWKSHFGQEAGAGSGRGAGAAVPEPSVASLICIAAIALLAARRFRRLNLSAVILEHWAN
jgi:hypothetical protein